ncbi:MerR family transcriptional regulator [Paraburkholderia flava]|uniref:MerR family transcriptional regulator n=1 Tax=Paraburkholderia flava TaxID=2547393 RepID=UPI00105F9E9D|nr:MerR family transcriptional regulator [Paraburkholderia flava]
MKIGELAAQTGLAPSAIRYYEQSGLLPEPTRGPNGYRVYPEAAIERLRLIRNAQQLGFSLDTLRDAFASTETLTADNLLCGLDKRLDEIAQSMATLRAQRSELQRLRALVVDARETGTCAGIVKGTHAETGACVEAPGVSSHKPEPGQPRKPSRPRAPAAPVRTVRNGLAQR